VIIARPLRMHNGRLPRGPPLCPKTVRSISLGIWLGLLNLHSLRRSYRDSYFQRNFVVAGIDKFGLVLSVSAPEPSALLLIGSGVAGLVILKRWRLG
jgi:hypothetical protein